MGSNPVTQGCVCQCTFGSVPFPIATTSVPNVKFCFIKQTGIPGQQYRPSEKSPLE